MDPLGLALENFNALGMWREKERKQPIDAAGKLITGEIVHERPGAEADPGDQPAAGFLPLPDREDADLRPGRGWSIMTWRRWTRSSRSWTPTREVFGAFERDSWNRRRFRGAGLPMGPRCSRHNGPTVDSVWERERVRSRGRVAPLAEQLVNGS